MDLLEELKERMRDEILDMDFPSDLYEPKDRRKWPEIQFLKNYSIGLCTDSERREKLLDEMDIEYRYWPQPVVEGEMPPDLQREEIPLFRAKQKADCYQGFIRKKGLLIVAETIIWFEGQLFNNPKNKPEAKKMLRKLAGKTHEVITGVVLTSQFKQKTFYEVTTVTLAKLSKEDINYYVTLYRPHDKKYVCGIHEWIGRIAVERIEGTYENAVGLPTRQLYQHLRDWELPES